jgi:hypothetical protein
MSKLVAIIEVLYQGKELADPAKWKNRQVLLNTAGGGGGLWLLLSSLNDLLPEGHTLSSGDIYNIGEAVAIIGGAIVNWYFTHATTTKIGFKSKSDS